MGSLQKLFALLARSPSNWLNALDSERLDDSFTGITRLVCDRLKASQIVCVIAPKNLVGYRNYPILHGHTLVNFPELYLSHGKIEAVSN